MAAWHKGALAAFDLETTGVDVETDRIVTACVARVDGSGRRQPSVATWLANPGIEIPEQASAIHGITTERAKTDGQDAKEVVSEVAAMLIRALSKGVPVVGFNIRFDLTLLDRECRRYGLPTVSELTGGCVPVVCARVLDKEASRRPGKRKLTDCCEFWQVPLESAHNAAADAVAAARLAVRIAEKKAHIAAMPLPELHAAQVAWHRDQCRSFAEWLRSRGNGEFAAQVEAEGEHWPVDPYERQEALR